MSTFVHNYRMRTESSRSSHGGEELASEASRMFVALPLDAPGKNRLQAWRRLAKPRLSFQKWIHPEDLHLTLKFLGDTDTSARSALEPLLRQAAASRPPFTLRLSGLGVFGPPALPQILWAGLQGELGPLRETQRAVEDAAAAAGFARELRAFKPHLTLARRYRGTSPFDRKLLGLAELTEPLQGEWTVRELVLFESHPGREPMYEPAARFELSGPRS